jgi:HEAT repeat protein
MNKASSIYLALALLLPAPEVFGLQKAIPKYNESKLQESFRQWVDGLDSLALTADYRKPIKDLLSADASRQYTAIQTLGGSSDVRAIPWLIPLIDQENQTLRVYAGSAIERIISSEIYKAPDGRPERVAALKPAAWIALQMFRKPEDGNTWAQAASISRMLGMKEFEDELMRVTGSKHPAASNAAKSALESLKASNQGIERPAPR